MSNTCEASAQVTGPPPKVVPCSPKWSRSFTAAGSSTADSGRPPASGLARVTMSGFSPALSEANR